MFTLIEIFKRYIKHFYEYRYWRHKYFYGNKKLTNNHYKYFCSDYFEIPLTSFKNKKLLDIGCGPRGSLEWANMAAERIGLDPLVKNYRNLGIERHKMKYVNAYAECIPFKDKYFDFVFSFNSLDHVDNLEKALGEIHRVLKMGGLFLLITEVNHSPTVCEPISYTWSIIEKIKKYGFQLIKEKRHEKISKGIYQSINQNIPYDMKDRSSRCGILNAKFIKIHNSNLI